jgi:uncharacterized membrane protein YeaQ/YmgE (transglycosylase-associated protein family)
LFSALTLRIVIWLCVPVYLHLNWVFPIPLGKLPRNFIWAIYGIFLAIAVAQAFQFVSQDLYYLGFLFAILGSLTLLVMHAIRQPESRRDLAVLTILVFLAFAPSIGIGIAAAIGTINGDFLNLGLLGYPLIPFAYLYAAYRRQLGDLEWRVNRLLSAYIFLILLGIIGVPFLAFIDNLLPSQNDTLIIGVSASVFTAVASIWVYPTFRRYIELHWLGTPLTAEQLTEVYSAHTTASPSLNALTDLLKEDVLPSLLVRQFAFL